MIFRPDIIPPNDTYWSFWLSNLSILIAALAFFSSALVAAYNALEQVHLRYMENYPYLEIFPILSVDPLPLPIPKFDTPPELSSYNIDYLKEFAPSHQHETSDTEFRFLAMVLRNVGYGYITRAIIKGHVSIPNRGYKETPFLVDRRINLSPGQTLAFTLLPISGLPEYKVSLDSVTYRSYFVEMQEYDGKYDFSEKHPYSIPPERTVVIFYDEFESMPAGQGWNLDFWGQWQATNYIFVPPPSQNEHFLILRGDQKVFSEFPHYQNQGGAFKDLQNIFTYGQTVKITARVRALPGTKARIQLWCNDLHPNPKNRFSQPITPREQWEEISILYTSTNSPNLRIHLLYTPGDGEIYVDQVKVEGLFT
ncbi:MAG: hypothetical protein DYH15_15050 [Nitrosomonas sp. PRO4]|nr:hypothetical protein [Nitrosomonas sp. PRO4]